jgi:hypothetical protein
LIPGVKEQMVSIQEKSAIIWASEEKFANALAAVVLDKPKISIWMILIPIIIVYHMFRYQKYVDGRNKFSEHYLLSRKRALEAGVRALESGQPCDVRGLVKQANIPEDTKSEYTAWIRVLCDHYADLLRCEGDSIEALVKSAYKNRTNFLLSLNQLSDSEKRFNAALSPHLLKTTEGVDEIIGRMEHVTEILRRDEAERIFP